MCVYAHCMLTVLEAAWQHVRLDGYFFVLPCGRCLCTVTRRVAVLLFHFNTAVIMLGHRGAGGRKRTTRRCLKSGSWAEKITPASSVWLSSCSGSVNGSQCCSSNHRTPCRSWWRGFPAILLGWEMQTSSEPSSHSIGCEQHETGAGMSPFAVASGEITPGSPWIWIDLFSELVQWVWGRCGRRSAWDESDSPSQTYAHDTETIRHVFLNTRGQSSPSGLNHIYSRGTVDAWKLLWSEPDDPRPVQRCACLQSHDKPLQWSHSRLDSRPLSPSRFSAVALSGSCKSHQHWAETTRPSKPFFFFFNDAYNLSFHLFISVRIEMCEITCLCRLLK